VRDPPTRASDVRAMAAQLVPLVVSGAGCTRSVSAGSDAADKGVVSVPSATAPGAPRVGMVWIPPGMLRAGSSPSEVPRVADVELPGVDLPLGGFYIDMLPWPNEPGAIPSTNVTRDEAQRLCGGKGKRLCTELEWERACKGPDNARYEYGSDYDERTCGAAVPAETAARRPSGKNTSCTSAFGVREMHGGAWEWTDSRWGRGATSDLGVMRGGSDPVAAVATRCAYARPLAPTERSPAAGFRCCAGPRNDAEVHLDVTFGVALERASRATQPSPPLDALAGAACGPPRSPTPCWSSRAWTWRPEPNVELSLAGGCEGLWPDTRCALAISRTIAEHCDKLAEVDTGQGVPDVVFIGGADRRIRVVGKGAHGRFVRELSFRYGRVDIQEVR
jgi:sulfatase modifying factor 1